MFISSSVDLYHNVKHYEIQKSHKSKQSGCIYVARFYIISGIIPIPEFEVCFVARADHLVNEFDQIKSISAFKDVHSNTGIFGIHTSTVSIKFTSLLVMHSVVILVNIM